MTTAAPSSTPAQETEPVAADADTTADSYFDATLPDGYDAILANEAIQFAPVEPKIAEPRQPSWIEELLNDFFNWLGQVLGPLGEALAGSWGVLQWVLIGALVLLALYFLARFVGPLADRRKAADASAAAEPEWQPDREESMALLEDADQLAAQGRYDEAARLLLQRSVGQIAAAKPEWVDPSSTARELAALPRLSEAARKAFGVISEAVERSLFALRSLSQDDWERARAAYADFALSRIEMRNNTRDQALSGDPA